VPRDAGRLGDPGHHPVGVAPVDRLAAQRSQDQRAAGALATAGLEDAQHRDGDRHGGGLVALADQPDDAMPSQGVGVVLDPHRCGFGGAQGVDAEQVRQGAVVDGDGLGDL
jgi:hypothetical protein